MKNSLLLSTLLLLIFSCKKDDATSSASALARTWLVQEVDLLGGAKTFVAYTKNGSRNASDYSKMKFVFKADGNVTSTNQDGSYQNGHWIFTNNNSKIQITYTDDSQDIYDVISLNSSSLIISKTLTKQQFGQAFDDLLQNLVTYVGFDSKLTALNYQIKLTSQ